MPYKRTKSKRTFKKRRQNPKSKQIRRIVKNEIDKEIENKVLFANHQNITIDNTLSTAVSTTTGISQGTTVLNRIGDKISAKRWSFQGKITKHASATTGSCVRMIVVRSISPEITFTADMFWFYNGTVGYEITSPINYPEKIGRYQILRDRVFNLNTEKNQIYFKFSLNINKPVYWDRSGNTAKGHLYVFFISDEAVNTPTIDYATYFSFQDA